MQRNGRRRDLHGHMSRGAERAIRARGISSRVGVSDPEGTGNDDQRDAQQREENPPRTLRLRLRSLTDHRPVNIVQPVQSRNLADGEQV